MRTPTRSMTSPLDPFLDTSSRESPLPRLWDVLAVCIGLVALVLAWKTGESSFFAPVEAHSDLYLIPSAVGVVLFSLLFAALALLSFRMVPDIYVGFRHLAVIAAYLALGPTSAIVVSF